ncbi:MAG: helix-turn-helix transcriptional regulator [Hyphomicrobiales bacterium]|nr:helix-turn-helix transcriptional regulator [Hyphomicrobiales bacterium]
MPYRHTDNVRRKLASRREAILAAARALAAEDGLAAVQVAPVAQRAGIAAGTIYRYFPSKIELVAALVAALAEAELAALTKAADAAPGPLSTLAAAVATFGARALSERRLAFALIAEPVEAAAAAARLEYRRALVGLFETRIRIAITARHLPDQDAATAAAALVGALVEGLIGPLAPPCGATPAQRHAVVQALARFALRGLGMLDARARGLVVQTKVATFG